MNFTIALQGVCVDVLCVVSAPGHTDDEKGGGGRTDAGESVFGCRMCFCTYCTTNHVFPPQRFGHMTGVYEQGRLVRLLRKKIFM